MGFLDQLEACLARRHRDRRTMHTTHHAHVLRNGPEQMDVRVRLELHWLLPWGSTLSRDLETAECDKLTAAVDRAVRPFSVLHREEAESAARLALGRTTTHQYLDRVHATLTVEQDAVDFAREQMLRDLETRRYHARQHAELARLEAFRETMLRDGATARLWWVGSDPGKLLDVVSHGDAFERALSVLASNASRPDASSRAESMVAKTVRDFLTDLGPEHRGFLLRQLAEVFRSYERPDLADQLTQAPGSPTSQARDHANGSTPRASTGQAE